MNHTTLESFIKEYVKLERERYSYENFIDNCDPSKYDLNEIILYGKSMQKKKVQITSPFITPEEAAFMTYQERPIYYKIRDDILESIKKPIPQNERLIHS